MEKCLLNRRQLASGLPYYVLRQASRRSWRIGARAPVEVTYLTYDATLQTEALGLVAAKLRSSLMVEGELPEDGLAALDGDGQDMVLALARRLTGDGAADARSLEALFAAARRAEAEADDALAESDPLAELARAFVEHEARTPALVEAPGGLPDVTARLPAEPTEPAPVLAGGTQLSFLELGERLRRAAPRPRQRRVAPDQPSLFG